MIKLIKFSENESKIFFSNVSDTILEIKIEIVDVYTNSLIQIHTMDLVPKVEYWLMTTLVWKNTRVNFYDRKNNSLIAPFIINGSIDILDIDSYGYIKKIQSKNDPYQQLGVNDVLREHFITKKYENFVDVEDGDVVVDVGFNYGIFSLSALKKGAQKIYGFEPNKNIFQKLIDFPEKDKVEIYNLAVSDSDGEVNFNEGYNTLGSTISKEYTLDTKLKYLVQKVDFFKFITEKGIEKIDFLKIDCEGEEYKIFNNIPDAFLRNIKKIHVEFHNNENKEVLILIDKLERNDFNWWFENGKNEDSQIGMIYAKKKNKSIVLISCFCDNEEKLNVLKKNIDLLKSNSLSIALISPILLPEEIIKSCDFVFFNKENPVLDWPTHAMYDWRNIPVGDSIYEIWNTYADYGWAGLLHVKRLGEIFSNYDYDYFYYMIYDTKITDQILDVFKIGYSKIVFPSRRGKILWQVGLHLMCFDKENLLKILDLISFEDYISYRSFDAFAFLHKHIVQPLNISIGKLEVEDWIFYYENVDNLNHSDVEGFKFFISSPDEVIENLKIFFYGQQTKKNIDLIVNDNKFVYEVSHGTIVDLGIGKKEVDKVSLIIDGQNYDLTKKINLIKNSHIRTIK